MKEFSKWDDKEVKKLFKLIERKRKSNKSLLEGFREYAKKTKRKPNSVRNYYYLEVESLKNNKKRAENLGINILKHETQKSDKFSKEETESLVMEILRLKCLGYSVRKACLKIANNSAEEMLRYQNKFRSVVSKDKDLYNRCLLRLKKDGLNKKQTSNEVNRSVNKSQKNENVIYMKKVEEKRLTDEDVNSLFLGLIRLVKKTAMETLKKDFANEIEITNSTFRKNLTKISKLEKEIENKNKEIEKEKEKNKKITEENFVLKTQMVNLLNKKTGNYQKNKSLSNYLREIKEKGIEIKTKIN